MGLPFLLVRHGSAAVPLLVGTGDVPGRLVGVDVVGLRVFDFEPGDAIAAVSVSPAAIYWGMEAQWARAAAPLRLASEASVRRFAPKGYRFAPMPSQLFADAPIITGYGEVRPALMRHRQEMPSIDTIRLSALFAVSTVRTSIEEAERSFDCFVELYERGGRQMEQVSVDDIRGCFRGLQNTKAKVFSEVAAYAPTIRKAIESGLKDRKLRRHLATETDLPTGLSLAKLSFTLALLGHDCVCLDARLLARMFDAKRRVEVEGSWGKTAAGRVSELSLRRYEAVEDSFLTGNPFYRASDPIGRARAQWLSWESVGGAAATHSVWLRVVS